MGEFGDKFRKTREKKGISLDDVSHVTKIGTRMLQAIEEENFDRLPGGVFNRGFIRAYAKHLGLNEEDAIASYLVCVQKTEIAAHQALQPEPSPSRAGSNAPRPTQQPRSRKLPLPSRNAPNCNFPAPITSARDRRISPETHPTFPGESSRSPSS